MAFSDDDSNHKTDKANVSSPSPVPSQSLTFPPPSGSKIPREAWKEVAILSSVATMIMYSETMLLPAIPTLIKEFGITYSTSSWILTTYLLTGAVMTPHFLVVHYYIINKKFFQCNLPSL